MLLQHFSVGVLDILALLPELHFSVSYKVAPLLCFKLQLKLFLRGSLCSNFQWENSIEVLAVSQIPAF